MNLCKICGNPSMVMDYRVVNGKQVYGKVPFKKNPDAKSFICGICVANGRLKPEVKQPEEEHFDLKKWRQTQGLSQNSLAKLLKVSQPMVAMVENGEKAMPAEWGKSLSGCKI